MRRWWGWARRYGSGWPSARPPGHGWFAAAAMILTWSSLRPALRWPSPPGTASSSSLRDGFPVNVLNPIKAVPEVCTIHCATANPVDIVVAVTPRGRGIVGVIDGQTPLGVETERDVADRHDLLRAIGYKL